MLTVHDSILCEVRKEHVDEALKIVYDTMTVPPFKSNVRFEIEASVGPTWGDVQVVEIPNAQ